MDSVVVVAQSSEVGVSGVQHKEGVVVRSKEPVRVSNDRDKVNFTIRGVAGVAAAEGLAGGTMTNRSETEIHLSLFVRVGR